MSIKKLFGSENKNINYSDYKDEKTTYELVESRKNAELTLENDATVIPRVNYNNPATFSKFGSAELYYQASFDKIINYYPYDGSHYEKEKFFNGLSEIEKHIFDKKYPRSNGYAHISATGWGTLNGSKTSDGYGTPTNLEYITFKGGPGTGSNSTGNLKDLAPNKYNSILNKGNVYDTDIYSTEGYPSDYGVGTRLSNLRSNFDDGVTVEFWLKKPAFDTSKTEKEVVLDVWNNYADSSNSYGRITIELTGAAGVTPFILTVQSGTTSTSVFTASIGNDLTTTSLQTWQHYAVSMQNSGSNFIAKLYVNGKLNDTESYSGTIAELNSKNMMGRIGALLTSPSGSTAPAGSGKLSGSIDEFRFWKEARNSRLIDYSWFKNVDGGTNTDISNATLGVYYKFNEGITLSSSSDSVVLDYAGRVTNGVWTGYTGQYSRNTGSAMVESLAAASEYLEPIIRSNHPTYISQRLDLITKGKNYDASNNALFMNYSPSWVIEEHDALGNDNLKYISHIFGSYMDRLYLLASEVPKLRQANYLSGSTEIDQKPYPISNHLPQSLGLYVPEIFVDAEIYELLYNRRFDKDFENNLQETKNSIYLNIYNNLANIFKAKGTEKAVRNVFRCYNIDDKLIKFKSYADETTYEIKNNIREQVIDADRINLNNTSSTKSVIYQKKNASNSDSSGYISGSYKSSVAGVENPYGFTMATNVVFPRYYSLADKVDRKPTQISLFGLHTVDTGSSDSLDGTTTTTLTANDYANFQVYAVRDDAKSKNVRFVLSSSGPYPIPEITSSTFFSVYDDNKWNLSVRLKPSNYPFSGFVSGAASYTYDVIFRGINQTQGAINDSFQVSSSITFDVGSKFLQSPKRIYLGARRENLTGTLLNSSDVMYDGARVWTKYVSDYNINQHLLERDNSAVSGTTQRISALDTTTESYDLLNINTLALDWNFAAVTGSDSSGNFNVQDFSSGSATIRNNYSWLGKISGQQHTGYGYGFPASSTEIVDKSFVTTFKFLDPEENISSDMINILEENDEYFDTYQTPPDYIFTVEKSMYGAISEEMLQFVAGVSDFNTLIGEPINRYRSRYKNLELLREIFFRRVTNVSDVEKFIKYYKWFDDSLSTVINQLMPASAQYTNDLLNVVESHTLERNKYETKFPTIETKDPVFPDAALYGWGEMNYRYDIGSSPRETTPGARNTNINHDYWFKRAERTATEISSSNGNVNATRDVLRQVVNSEPALSQSGYTVRTLAGTQYKTKKYERNNFIKLSNLKVESLLSPHTFASIHGGVNFEPSKRIDLTYAALRPAGPIDTTGGRFVPQNILVGFSNDLVPLSDNQDPHRPPNKKVKRHVKVLMGNKFTTGQEYTDIKSTHVFPFNIISSSLSTGYQSIVQSKLPHNIEITNLHNDVYGPSMEKPMQGPFTEYAVGGHQSRHVPINFNATDRWYNRPEAWYILLGTCNVGLSGAIGMVGPDYPWPDPENTWATPAYPATGGLKAPFYRDELAKRPVNIRNIRLMTGSTILGNYRKNYEVVHAVGARANPRRFIDNQPVLSPVISSGKMLYSNVTNTIFDVRRLDDGHFEFVTDYSLSYLTGSTNRTIITNTFGAPGGIETGKRYSDFRSTEFSPYNVLGYRNLSVIRPLQIASGTLSETTGAGGLSRIRVVDFADSDFGLVANQARPSGKFGRDIRFVTNPGASYTQTAAFHKVPRNKLKVIKQDTNGAYYTGSSFDNFFIQRPIPRSTTNYRWITGTVLTTPYGYGFAPTSFRYKTGDGTMAPAMTFVSQSDFGTIINGGQRYYGAATTGVQYIPNDFVGLNLNIVQEISTKYMTVGNYGYNNVTAFEEPYQGVSASTTYLNTDFVDGGILNALPGAGTLLNGIINNRNGAWGLSSWNYGRNSENRLLKYLKRNNLFSTPSALCHEYGTFHMPATTIMVAPIIEIDIDTSTGVDMSGLMGAVASAVSTPTEIDISSYGSPLGSSPTPTPTGPMGTTPVSPSPSYSYYTGATTSIVTAPTPSGLESILAGLDPEIYTTDEIFTYTKELIATSIEAIYGSTAYRPWEMYGVQPMSYVGQEEEKTGPGGIPVGSDFELSSPGGTAADGGGYMAGPGGSWDGGPASKETAFGDGNWTGQMWDLGPAPGEKEYTGNKKGQTIKEILDAIMDFLVTVIGAGVSAVISLINSVFSAMGIGTDAGSFLGATGTGGSTGTPGGSSGGSPGDTPGPEDPEPDADDGKGIDLDAPWGEGANETLVITDTREATWGSSSPAGFGLYKGSYSNLFAQGSGGSQAGGVYSYKDFSPSNKSLDVSDAKGMGKDVAKLVFDVITGGGAGSLAGAYNQNPKAPGGFALGNTGLSLKITPNVKSPTNSTVGFGGAFIPGPGSVPGYTGPGSILGLRVMTGSIRDASRVARVPGSRIGSGRSQFRMRQRFFENKGNVQRAKKAVAASFNMSPQDLYNQFRVSEGRATLRFADVDYEKLYYGNKDFAYLSTFGKKQITNQSLLDRIIRTVNSNPGKIKINWLKTEQGIYPSARNLNESSVINKSSFVNNYWRSSRINRNTGSTNSLGVTYTSATAQGRPPISQSIFCMDAPSDFLTRTKPPNTISSSNIAVIRQSVLSSGSAGELQNTYTTYFTGSNYSAALTETANKLSVGPLFSRKQTVSNPNSLTSMMGPQIPETSSYTTINQWTPAKSIKIFGGEAEFQPELAGIVRRDTNNTKATLAFVSAASEPWYDSYEDFKNDGLNSTTKTMSILPEYRISEHIDDILEYGINDKTKTDNFEIPETGINSTDDSFYITYTNTDFLKNVVKTNITTDLDPSEIRLKFKAAIKFNPYKGFYPAQRTIQLVEKFNETYKDSYLAVFGGNVNKLKSTDNNFAIARNVISPLFAPGILYNSIKSSIAVDYPVISSIFRKRRMQFSASSAPPNNWALVQNVRASNDFFNDDIITLSSSFWDTRLPFETLITPHTFINNLGLADLESHPSCSIEPLNGTDAQKEMLATLSPRPVSREYSLMMRNFLGGVADFFLEDSGYSKLESNVISSDLKFKKDDVFISRLKFYRSTTGSIEYTNEQSTTAVSILGENPFTKFGMKPYVEGKFLPSQNSSFIELPQYPLRTSGEDKLKETFTTYSRTTAFGPPIAGTITSSMNGYRYHTVYDSFTGHNPAFTDCSRDGEGWVDFIFRPTGSESYDLERILAETKVNFWRFDPGYIISGSTQLIYEAQISGSGDNSGQTYYYTGSAAPYSGRVINQNSMQMSASFNLFGIERVQFEQEDELTGRKSKRNTSVGQKWVIQSKFETPALNFSDYTVRRLTSSILSIPTYAPESVPRGIWHQFGLIPDKKQGLYLEFTEPSADWFRYHYDVRTNDTVYNNQDAAANGENLHKKVKSFKNLFGFTEKNQKTKIGNLKDKLVVKEAIVAIPYTQADESRQNNLTGKKNSKSKNFISIPMDRINASLDDLIDTKVGDSLSAAGKSVRELTERMDEFVIPPQFDFLNNRELKPIVMYIIPFEYTFDKDDLSYIWQNIAPRNFKDVTFQEKSVCHMLANNELFSQDNLLDNDNLHWMVFKVKQRVQSDYYDKMVSQAGEASSDNFINKNKKLNVIHNWPYDYFSFVEMGALSVDLLYKPDVNNPKAVSRQKKYINKLNRMKDPVNFKRINTLSMGGQGNDLPLMGGQGNDLPVVRQPNNLAGVDTDTLTKYFTSNLNRKTKK